MNLYLIKWSTIFCKDMSVIFIINKGLSLHFSKSMKIVNVNGRFNNKVNNDILFQGKPTYKYDFVMICI